jgi:predicted trehalose synthase
MKAPDLGCRGSVDNSPLISCEGVGERHLFFIQRPLTVGVCAKLLTRHEKSWPGSDQLPPIRVVSSRLPARLRELLPETIDAMKIRHHGDFHLGQMLIAKDDVSIIDFEGEPRRSIEDRRRKAPAARDVAGLMRSIDYSATAALKRALKSAPDEHGRLVHALEDWREHSVAACV